MTNLQSEILSFRAVAPPRTFGSTKHTSTCVQESVRDQAQGIFCGVLYSETALFQTADSHLLHALKQ